MSRRPDAVNRVAASRPDRPKGSIYNATKALSEEGLIERAEGGWLYCGDDDEHPVFASGSTATGGWVWGPLTAFSKQDIAHHRRRAICHILALESRGGGLMTTQIVAKLQDAKAWMRAPVSNEPRRVLRSASYLSAARPVAAAVCRCKRLNRPELLET